MKWLLTICAAAMSLMFGVAVPTAFATTVPAQDPVFLNPPNFDGKYRINDLGRRQQRAGSFQLTGPNLTITEVDWWGAYRSFSNPAPTDDFVIRFFESTKKKPFDVPLWEAEIPAENLTRTPVFTTDLALYCGDNHDGGHHGHDNDIIYQYSADLPSPITLNPGTTYYLSVVNNTKSGWGWLEASSASWHWHQYQYGDESDEHGWHTSCRNRDMSFELFAVPEPATVVFTFTGILALARRRRSGTNITEKT